MRKGKVVAIQHVFHRSVYLISWRPELDHCPLRFKGTWENTILRNLKFATAPVSEHKMKSGEKVIRFYLRIFLSQIPFPSMKLQQVSRTETGSYHAKLCMYLSLLKMMTFLNEESVLSSWEESFPTLFCSTGYLNSSRDSYIYKSVMIWCQPV